MRNVKNFSDVNIVIKELLDFKEKFTAKTIDFGGRRLANVGKAVEQTDAVIFSQLPTIQAAAEEKVKDQVYTILFSKDAALTDLNLSPAYTVGKGKEGIPMEVWINAETPPSDGNLICNPTYNGIPILKNPIEFSPSDIDSIFSSDFVDPVPVFGSRGKILPGVITANGAALFSLGIVVKKVLRTL